MKIGFSAMSHIGNVRENNEDNLYCAGHIIAPDENGAAFALSGETTTPCVFAVCDGMGGEAFGAFASFTAANAVKGLEDAVKSAMFTETDRLVQGYITKTNALICDEMRRQSAQIGTTAALAVITESGVKPYNIGDSRIYSLSGGLLKQISTEHTLAEQKVKMGIITKEQAKYDRDRHRLTRFLGIFEEETVIEAEILPVLPLSGLSRLLICSDGLTDMVSDSKIKEILASTKAADAAMMLTDEALTNGGKDNITCVVIGSAEK